MTVGEHTLGQNWHVQQNSGKKKKTFYRGNAFLSQKRHGQEVIQHIHPHCMNECTTEIKVK